MWRALTDWPTCISQFRDSVQHILGKSAGDGDLFSEIDKISSLESQINGLGKELKLARETVSIQYC